MPRRELNFDSTSCSCRECTLCCQHVPGMLGPNDLQRIATFLGYGDDLVKFARENLLASPGATVRLASGELMRIPTLVPARQANGHCKFLKDSRCAIYPVSPFGCAYFDTHQNARVGNTRSVAIHREIYAAQLDPESDYARLWMMLYDLGLRAPQPKVGWDKMRAEVR